MLLLDVSEYASQHASNLPYTGFGLAMIVIVAVCLAVLAGVVWACLAVASATDRDDGR